jgi:chromosome segregation ATPase
MKDFPEQTENTKLKARIRDDTKHIKDLHKSIDEMLGYEEKLENKISKLKEELDEWKADNKQQEDEITELEAALEQKEGEILTRIDAYEELEAENTQLKSNFDEGLAKWSKKEIRYYDEIMALKKELKDSKKNWQQKCNVHYPENAKRCDKCVDEAKQEAKKELNRIKKKHKLGATDSNVKTSYIKHNNGATKPKGDEG